MIPNNNFYFSFNIRFKENELFHDKYVKEVEFDSIRFKIDNMNLNCVNDSANR